MNTIAQDNQIAPKSGGRTLVRIPSTVLAIARNDTTVLVALAFLTCSVCISLEPNGLLEAFPALSRSIHSEETVEFTVVAETEEVVEILAGGKCYVK